MKEPCYYRKKYNEKLAPFKKTPYLCQRIKNNGVTIPKSDGQTLGKIERLGLFLL